MSEHQHSGSSRKLRTIADRYRVQGRLGRGGIAEVYHVVDEATEKDVALKILLQEASQKPHLVGLFEREFHTLAQLAHPRIIEVYDYGFHLDRSYYTMELLDGSDLRKLAPIEWKHACSLLRDVALSLALLHSRRLIHRDISARNVRCDRDGRAKLIDFGALSPIGKAVRLIGTAAFVAPEAINHQPLDQRTDLYALGSLAYLLITGRYAYRAHYITHLKDAWRSRPPSVTELKPEVPKPLSDLTMSLISLARMARPVYASEVAEMLGAYAGLQPDDSVEVKQAYLATPKLVGRSGVTTELLKQMVRLLGGAASKPLLFEGPSGIGRSRLLSELVLEGKVIGASVLTTNAEASLHGAYGAALDLTEQLFETCYDHAAEAIKPHLGLLRQAFPHLVTLIQTRAQNRTVDTFGFDTQTQEPCTESGGGSRPVEQNQGARLPLMQSERNIDKLELRPKIQKALLDLFLEVSRKRRLVIAVDDLHLVDEPSTAFVSSLALESQKHTLMVAVSAEQEKTGIESAAFQTLLQIARRIEVTPLDQDAAGSLLRSIFGEAPNIQLLAERLYKISKGNPRAIVQLAQHLVDRAVVSYRSGSWTIPNQIDTADLPDSLIDALRARVKEFSGQALTLVRTLALSTARNFSFEECMFLTEDADTAQLTQELNRLVAAEILSTEGRFYSLSQEAIKGILIEDLDDATASSAHIKLAKLFQLRYRVDFRAIQHLIGARQYHDALDLLIEHIEITLNTINRKREAQFDYLHSLPDGWSETIEDTMKLVNRLNRPQRERYLIHYFFVRLSSATGFVSKDDFRSVIDQLYHDCGLDIYHNIEERFEAAEKAPSSATDDSSPPNRSNSKELERLHLQHSLKLAQQRYDDTDPLERGFSPKEALAMLPGAVLAAASLATTSFDYSVLEMLPSLEPFFPLSPGIRILQEHVQAAGHITCGRLDQARQKYLALLQWVAGPDSAVLDQAYREYMRCSFNFAVGHIETFGIPSALERADAIDHHPLYQVNAWLIRTVYSIRKGEYLAAQKNQRTFELLQVQNNSTQMFVGVQWFTILTTYTVYDDLSGVNQAIGHIEKMAKCFDGWVPIYHYALGERHRIRGEYSDALQQFEKALEQIAPGKSIAWAYTAGAHLRVLAALNRLHEAHDMALVYLKEAEQAELHIASSHILLPLAIIEAKLEQEESAEKRVERVIAYWNLLGASGVFLGSAYETAACVAIYSDDHKKFRKYAKLCKEQYYTGEHPLLIARFEKLMEQARLVYLGISTEMKQGSETTASLSRGGNLVIGVHDYLAKYQSQQELFQGALDLMIKRAGSSEGYLYIATQSSLKLVKQIAVQPPPEQIIENLQASFARVFEEDGELEISETATQTATETDDVHSTATEFESIDFRFLSAEVNCRQVPVGAVVLRYKAKSMDRVEQSFFEAVALCLYKRIQQEGQAEHQTERSVPRVDQSRYQIEALLGEGGMASVCEVTDRETGKRLALKRARVSIDRANRFTGSVDISMQRKKLENALRREYQMLKSLAHPRIVQVFDFGVHEEGPYYTMELLEGTSLRQKAPLDWKKACALLRDLASALSFLHARRLLHRDLSPRNIGMTADNHVKLMDFGTTVPMGTATDRVGTPPFIAPEVVYRQKLDQRSDLYSFGALAYWLLTGRHAYPARNFNELKDLWRVQTLSISEVVAKLETLEPIPEALDQLVMSLLSIDPLARPPSAAEVMERLIAIASLPVDEQLTVPQAYLTTPTLVGRQDQLLQVRKQAIRCLRGRGGTILISGVSGVGRSRLLDASVMESKLAGMVVVKVESRNAGRNDYGVAKAFARQLMEELPDIARNTATPYLSLLTRIVPEFGDSVRRGAGLANDEENSITDYSQPTASLNTLRPQIQVALRDWIVEISDQRAVVLAVDNLHLIDEPSAAFLALLSQVVTDKRLLVIATTVSSTETHTSTNAIEGIREASSLIEIKELSLQDTQQLLESVFGQAGNVRLLADRLFAISQGNPSVVMQLAQHLVEAQVVCYQRGAWILPAQIDSSDLPSGLKDTFKTRIEKLSGDALQLAQTMAQSPDQSFTFEECLLLTEHKDVDRLALSIDELLVFEIIINNGDYYASSHQGWVSVLQNHLNESFARRAYLRLAEVFGARDNEQFRFGYYLIRAGENEKAIDVFADFCRESRKAHREKPETFNQLQQTFPHDWFQILQTAIELAKQSGRPLEQIHVLQTELHAWGAIMGMVDKQNTRELFERLHRDSGLEFYYELSDSLGEQRRVQRAIELVHQRYEKTPESERVLAPEDAIREFSAALLEAMSPALMFGDYAYWNTLPSIKPFVSLSPTLEIIDRLVEVVFDYIGGRLEQYYHKNKKILERVNHPDHAGFDGVHYQYMNYALNFSLGLMEALTGRESALERATALESSSLLQVNAWQIRQLYYLWQGAVKETLNCRRQVETLQIQNSPSRTWFGRVLRIELRAYCLIDDLSNLRNLMHEVEKMVSISSVWTPTLHYAKGEYYRISGDYSKAIDELKEGLRLTTPGRHQYWASLADAYLRTLLAQERDEQICNESQRFLQVAEEEELGFMGNYFRMSLAIAQARLKDAASATANAETVVGNFKKLGATGLNLGMAYETRARVAILLDDEPGFVHFAQFCADRYRTGGNSCLIAKYEKLMQEARQAEFTIPPLGDEATAQHVDLHIDNVYQGIRTELDRCRSSDQRAECALAILADHCDSKGGYLFGLQANGLKTLSNNTRNSVPQKLFKTVSVYMEAELKDSTEATVTELDEDAAGGSNPAFVLEDSTRVELILVQGFKQTQPVVVGVAALIPAHGQLSSVNPAVIRAISDALLESGEVTSRIAA